VLGEERDDGGAKITREPFFAPRLEGERVADPIEQYHLLRNAVALEHGRQFLRLKEIDCRVSAAGKVARTRPRWNCGRWCHRVSRHRMETIRALLVRRPRVVAVETAERLTNRSLSPVLDFKEYHLR